MNSIYVVGISSSVKKKHHIDCFSFEIDKNDFKLFIAVVVNLEHKTSGYHSHKS